VAGTEHANPSQWPARCCLALTDNASLCRSVNAALARYPEARRRLLQLHAPIILAVWPQARLVQEEASAAAYGEVYEAHCARYHRDADRPILHYKEHVYGNVPEGTTRARRSAARVLLPNAAARSMIGSCAELAVLLCSAFSAGWARW
jgi:hypothetical protein